MFDINNFTFEETIQVRWSDLDPLGHVNNAVFVTFFEIARGMYMLHASPKWNWKKDMFLIGNLQVNYLKELTLFDIQPRVAVRTNKIGTKSFVIEYAVLSNNVNGETQLHATGETTQIMFDLKTKKTIVIEEWLKSHLISFEKEKSITI